MSGKLLELAVGLETPISHAAARVLMVLAKHANDDGSSCFPSLETIAKMGQLNKVTVIRCLAQLGEAGLLTQETGGGRKRKNRYRLTLGQPVARADPSNPDLFPETVAWRNRIAKQPKRGKSPGNGCVVSRNGCATQPDSIKTQGSVADATAQSAPPPPPSRPISDKEAVFTEGVETVVRLTALQPEPARRFVGGMLARTADNHARVLTIIRQCEASGQIDPRGWLMAKTGGSNVVRGEFGQATRRISQREANMGSVLRDLGIRSPADEPDSPVIEGVAL